MKKLISLDTFIISNIAQALERTARSELDDLYLKLYSVAAEARRKDTVAFPATQALHDEIGLAQHTFAKMREVVHALAWGLRAREIEAIRVDHLVRCAQAHERDQPLPPLLVSEVFEEDPAAPAASRGVDFLGGNILLTVDSPVTSKLIERRQQSRRAREQGYEQLRQRNLAAGRSFRDIRFLEGWATIAWHYFFAPFGVAYAEAMDGGATLVDRLRLTPNVHEAALNECDGLLHAASKVGLKADVLFAFLTSTAVLDVSSIAIESTITAAIMTDKVRPVEIGDQNDIENAAMLLPVCDVFVCDKRIADLLTRKFGSDGSLASRFPSTAILTGKPDDLRKLIENIEGAAG